MTDLAFFVSQKDMRVCGDSRRTTMRTLLHALTAICVLYACRTNAQGNGMVKVASAEELKKAVDDGAVHIHITDHLNLTTLPILPAKFANGVSAYFVLGEELLSITVRPCR